MTDTMFSARQVPWMKIGALEEGVKTANEAAELGGLNFTVEQRPLLWTDENGQAHSIPGRRALVRTDTNEWLSIMSTNYPVLQYGEAFDFMDGVSPSFVAAGQLKGGRQGFMVVEGPDMPVLGGDDPHKLFIVLRTSHDGSRAVEVAMMPLRGKCMNQLTLNSLTVGAHSRWAIRHTTSMKQKLADAQSSLQQAGVYAAKFGEVVEQLVLVSLDDDLANGLLTSVLPDRPKRDEQIASIIDKWHTAETVGFDWTGWGLLNAASEYFEWGRSNGTPESRFIGALQGSTHSVINNVSRELLQLAA